ncbi:hypothetical protein CSHISOI_00485 [Colletotrichum shisoi]|uniref:Uncharacterized protein n=1 Tax=Colletotrichum shisoi TaxID=2078593 RepID=A0A5Q4C804_9PEZI|nr:hypothetical protein CSHISOI_00485 [Colletotrichum shisoi]
MTVHLGPQAMLSYGNATTYNSAKLIEGNPRCLTRDFDAYPLRQWANSGNMMNLTRGNSAVNKFQAVAKEVIVSVGEFEARRWAGEEEQPGTIESRASRPSGHNVLAVMGKHTGVPQCGLSPERPPFSSGSLLIFH